MRQFTLFVAILAVAGSLAMGQIPVREGGERFKALTEPEKKQPQNTPISLEEPVDPSEYILGPGDQLELGIWGDIQNIIPLQIGPDGKVSVPTVGVLDFKDHTLKQAEEELKKAVLNVYSKSPVTLRLTNPRMIKVSISGAVETPGFYEVSSVDRISQLIANAGGMLKPDEEKLPLKTTGIMSEQTKEKKKKEEEEKPQVKPSLRHLRVTKRSGEIKNIDYLRFLKCGELSSNPVLYDGDNVHIPIKVEKVGVVSIKGAVREAGEFEFVEGDDIFDLVEIAGGFKPDALKSEIELVRFDNGKSQSPIIIDASGEAGKDGVFKLQEDDRIYVRSSFRFHRKHQVNVTGEVRCPGYYPIEEDVTTLTDILTACGGVTANANLNNAFVIRRKAEDSKDPEFERLKNMAVSDMNEMEYEYFKTRSRIEDQLVVVDFSSLLKEGDLSENIKLLDRDEIVIPELSPTVNVMGQVNRPGLVRWIPGATVDYYIEKAGGFSWNARKSKLRLIKTNSGKWVAPKKEIPIEIGDTIFIPEKQEIEYWELWKDIMLVVSQLATIILVVRTVR